MDDTRSSWTSETSLGLGLPQAKACTQAGVVLFEEGETVMSTVAELGIV